MIDNEETVKYLIVGRSGSGKDFLKDILTKDHGWQFVNSYTTRPKRYPTEDTHRFIDSDTAAKDFPIGTTAAETEINGYRYFATKEQVLNADGYIIDPNGVDELLHNMPDTVFKIVSIQAETMNERKSHAISRAADPSAEKSVFFNRNNSESVQFDDFESNLDTLPTRYSNCDSATVVINDYNPTTLKKAADKINIEKERSGHQRQPTKKEVTQSCKEAMIIENKRLTGKIEKKEKNYPLNR